MDSILNNFKDLIDIILSFLIGTGIGMGISFHFIKKHYIKNINQVQKNGKFSENNIQIGEYNVRK